MTHPYASAAYARVFEDIAQPLWVEAWGAYVLTREIPDEGGRDGLGIYPLAPFAPGADLKAGLAWLKDQGLVSIGLVPDPATAPPLADLQAAFALCAPFKTHLLVDYRRPVEFSKHHRGKVKRALEKVTVEVVSLAEQLDAWCGLYGNLIDRHEIGGLSAFSRPAFERLADVEGLTAVAAFVEGVVVSMHLWLADPASKQGYSLLAATSPEGYRRSAAYAVNDVSLRLLADLTCLNLGGGAGLATEQEDGLTYFKRGFSNREVQAYFCGAILDENRYAALSNGMIEAATPFPAYRFAPPPPDDVRLRDLRAGDLPLLHRWYQTPALWDHLVGDFTARAETEAVTYMQQWLAPLETELRLGVEASGPQGPRLVGLAVFSPLDRAAGWAELHIMIGDPGERGRGVGRRAVAALMARGWALGLVRIELRVLETNVAARRLYERCGFRTVGRDTSAQKAGRRVGVLVMQADQPASATT